MVRGLLQHGDGDSLDDNHLHRHILKQDASLGQCRRVALSILARRIIKGTKIEGKRMETKGCKNWRWDESKAQASQAGACAVLPQNTIVLVL